MPFQGVTEHMKLIGEANPEFDSLASEAEKRTVRAAERGAQRTKEEHQELVTSVLGKTEIRARYKIEVTFGPGRTIRGPNLCGVRVWESGKRLHGGGDELAFWCLSSDDSVKAGCGGVIIGDHIKGGVAICPHCLRAINAALLTDIKIGKPSTKNLATMVVQLFHQLGDSADIYLKFHQTDIRYQAMLKAKGLEVARRLKGMHIYPLRRILQDTANGSDLAGRVFAFLTS